MKNGYRRLFVLVIAVVLIAMPLEAAIRRPVQVESGPVAGVPGDDPSIMGYSGEFLSPLLLSEIRDTRGSTAPWPSGPPCACATPSSMMPI